jgi:hypothetical protein
VRHQRSAGWIVWMDMDSLVAEYRECSIPE